GLLDVATDANRRGWTWRRRHTTRAAKYASQKPIIETAGRAALHFVRCPARNTHWARIDNLRDVFRDGYGRRHRRLFHGGRFWLNDRRRLGNGRLFHDMAWRTWRFAQGRRGRGWRSRHI